VGRLASAILDARAGDLISAIRIASSYKGGGGIMSSTSPLVDFRAFDAAIIVLGIAGLAIFALLDPTARRLRETRLPRSWRTDMPLSPERPPDDVRRCLSRLLLPLILAAGIYIFCAVTTRPAATSS
jgi:multicomponent K+:H+ antiporter subunit A